jgi:hypothetical protein
MVLRQRRSTGDLFTTTTQRLNSTLHNYSEACVVALDISMAFNQVWYTALVAKYLETFLLN